MDMSWVQSHQNKSGLSGPSACIKHHSRPLHHCGLTLLTWSQARTLKLPRRPLSRSAMDYTACQQLGRHRISWLLAMRMEAAAAHR